MLCTGNQLQARSAAATKHRPHPLTLHHINPVYDHFRPNSPTTFENKTGQSVRPDSTINEKENERHSAQPNPVKSPTVVAGLRSAKSNFDTIDTQSITPPTGFQYNNNPASHSTVIPKQTPHILQQEAQPSPSRPPSTVQRHLHPQLPSPALQVEQTSYPSPYHSPNLVNSPHGHSYSQQHLVSGPGQSSHYYAQQPPYATPASSHFPAASTPELMAAAQMHRPTYNTPIYHTAQSTSPNSVASQPTHDYGRLYGQQSMNHSMQYGSYPSISQAPAYGHHPNQTATPAYGLNSQPLLMLQQQNPPTLPHPRQPSMNTSPRTEHDTPLSRTMDLTRTPGGTMTSPIASTPSANGGHHNTTSTAAPGPIPATTPIIVRQDDDGVQWISFEYSRDRVKIEHHIRCDVESVNVDELPKKSKEENCVYPRACVSKDDYKGNRYHYETECNTVGWALSELNPILRGKRGLIQRAVDSWRNSHQNSKYRSRRVRRQAKNEKRRVSQGPTLGGLMAPSPAIHRSIPLGSPSQRSSMSMGGPQSLHHHANHHSTMHQGGSDDVSDTSHNDAMRPAHVFHGYPNDSSQHTVASASIMPDMHDAMEVLGSPIPHSSSRLIVASGSLKREYGEDEATQSDLFGNVPREKRRKFILLTDPERTDPQQKKKRIRVQIDGVDLQEVPDSYRKQNAVYPRSYSPQQILRDRPPPDSRFLTDGEADPGDPRACLGRTLVPLRYLGGEQLAIPQLSLSKQKREDVLNNIGYRLLWKNRGTFADRTLFLQRSIDLYRKISRDTILQQNVSATGRGAVETDTDRLPAQFQLRAGKRKWLAYRERSCREDEVEDTGHSL